MQFMAQVVAASKLVLARNRMLAHAAFRAQRPQISWADAVVTHNPTWSPR